MRSSKKEQDSLLKWFQEKLSKSSDVEQRSLGNSDQQVNLMYLRSVSDSKVVNQYIIRPYYEMEEEGVYEKYIASFPGSKSSQDAKEALELLLNGYIAIFFNEGTLYLFDAVRAEAGPVAEAQTEVIVQGPSDSFNESMDVNMNLIRRRYQSGDLKAETTTVGHKSKTKIAIMYDETRVDPQVLKELKKCLDGINIDILQAAAELDKYLSGNKYRLFPTTIVTERPDRAVFNISEGKIILIVDTAGFVVILPAVFSDFFTAMDDKLQVLPVGWFLKGIRYLGLILTVLIPGLYVAFTSYNPEVWKVQIALLVAGSRATVPYPSYIEVLIMLLMMEFLTEASLRLPKAIGPTATTVGGLILGTAATEAGLVSNIMIILVSAVAISNFVIPMNMMGFTIRVIKYPFIFLATIYGLLGIVLGLVSVIMYLSSLRSFGQPYFKIYALDRIRTNKVQRERENG
ncbi:spore germination protein [Paenibacillus sp. YPG26]|uniref:spore germination protein n=1 Tax=Paenibacillus sp. YPG26 TaxID=2878915 RepID=UPI00203CF8A1|nr:spore germination protein [Paenibacillus sp. YPG26]USB33998.1 spore germination protein [Paenibacillus sp. YPG26]